MYWIGDDLMNWNLLLVRVKSESKREIFVKVIKQDIVKLWMLLFWIWWENLIVRIIKSTSFVWSYVVVKRYFPPRVTRFFLQQGIHLTISLKVILSARTPSKHDSAQRCNTEWSYPHLCSRRFHERRLAGETGALVTGNHDPVHRGWTGYLYQYPSTFVSRDL